MCFPKISNSIYHPPNEESYVVCSRNGVVCNIDKVHVCFNTALKSMYSISINSRLPLSVHMAPKSHQKYRSISSFQSSHVFVTSTYFTSTCNACTVPCVYFISNHKHEVFVLYSYTLTWKQ